MSLSRHRCSRALSFWSWSAKASFSLSPTPKISVSSKIGMTPSSPWKALSSLLWNSSGAGDIPNGILVQRYLPQGIPKVVRRLLSSSSWTCQNPFLPSTTENTLALVSLARRSSSNGKGYWFLFSALLSGFGSIHKRILPFLLWAITRDETQSVGASTGTSNPFFSSRSGSCLSHSLRANGTFRTGRTTGGTDLSTCKWSFSWSIPSPS